MRKKDAAMRNLMRLLYQRGSRWGLVIYPEPSEQKDAAPEGEPTDDLATAIEEARRQGIEVLFPAPPEPEYRLADIDIAAFAEFVKRVSDEGIEVMVVSDETAKEMGDRLLSDADLQRIVDALRDPAVRDNPAEPDAEGE